MPSFNDLPSLNALRVLEAAVRHRGFTAAAQELGVTQAAVSRQIALLERELGTVLFVRRHRAVEPTPACQMLAASLALSFARIAESVEAVQSVQRQDIVTVGATLAFSTLWLLPRLGEFRQQCPGAQIRLVSQDARIDLHAGEVDVLVRFGTPPFDDGQVVASRSDEIFPVCSPALAQRLGAPEQIFAQGQADLIGQDIPDRSWYGWADWCAQAGVTTRAASPALHCNHYTEVIQAARAGQGVALGWRLLVQSHLDEGSLVRLGTAVVRPEGRYNVLVPSRRRIHAMRDLFVEWLARRLGA